MTAGWTTSISTPRTFFRKIPAPLRPFLVPMIRRQVRRALHGQGMGRHSPEEIVALGTRSIDATADFLGTKPYLMGSEPTAVDATAFAFLAGVLCPLFDTKLRTAAEHRDNLRRYVGRMTVRFYPDRSELAGCQAAA
jgi:glutathione S-transferase